MAFRQDGRGAKGLLDLPREVLRNIALHIYDPLQLSQQDRLTWGIFSTVDMHEERQDALASLVDFGQTCRKVRKEVRIVLFRCVRTPTVQHLKTVVANKDGWARYVKSIIIDLSMFDPDDEDDVTLVDHSSRSLARRSCWIESTLLTNLITSLPSLNHISFFADASDDSTLALLFASLTPHPSAHPVPPPTVPSSPSGRSTSSGYAPPLPFATRIQSFGWRQRAPPPAQFRLFSQSSAFVSTLHLIRHAHRLSFLVLDADLDEMYKEDVLTACKELDLRSAPHGEEAEKVSLMLCGPIRGWGRGFLQELVDTFKGVKELFIDRPLRKSMKEHETTIQAFTSLVEPLAQMPHLQLLQVGSYIFPLADQLSVGMYLAKVIPSLLVLGLLGEGGDTHWWGIWRNASRRASLAGQSIYDGELDVKLVPLADGHLAKLEGEARLRKGGSILSLNAIGQEKLVDA